MRHRHQHRHRHRFRFGLLRKLRMLFGKNETQKGGEER